MGVFLFMLVIFSVAGIAAHIYLFRKIYRITDFLGSGLSKLKKTIISICVFVLMLIPAFFF